MKYNAPLYLASQSRMRRVLLKQACIPFSLLEQSADEADCDWNEEPLIVASSIARYKMDHVILPTDGHDCYVITADTICVDSKGAIHGKPVDHADAIKMLKLWREGALVITGFCIDKKSYTNSTWYTTERIEEVVTTEIDFSIPDEWLKEYLKRTSFMDCSGAMTEEDYGFQFVKSIHGSYSNIIGLPLFEVRKALMAMDFFVF